MIGFELTAFLEECEQFTAQVPGVLRRSSVTLDLADEVARAFERTEMPFTLAIVGQMRVGKSTIVNALLGEDLAAVGVNETTATVNWIRHGTPAECKKFRVVWRDDLGKPPEELDLSDLPKWLGDSDLARQTRYLEFRSTAEFLKIVQIVDTPGTRSVLHEEVIQGFLAERHERETLFYGGAADCILYVLNPVARESDAGLLQAFESQTRLPSSSPYNSVAAIHKWETLEESDPFHAAAGKARTIAGQLHRQVADAIPVSGPLCIAVSRLPVGYWDRVAQFAASTSDAAFEHVFSMLERRFGSQRIDGAGLDAEGRGKLRKDSGLPWPCFLAVLRLARKARCPDGESLRRQIDEAAGMTRLVQFLHRRFFDRARVIRSFNLLRKAVQPCEIGLQRLRDRIATLRTRSSLAAEAVRQFEPYRQRMPQAAEIIDAVSRETQTELDHLQQVQRELEDAVRTVREGYELLNRDFEAIRLLDENPNLFHQDAHREIQTVLGAFGYSIQERLACYPPGSLNLCIDRRLTHWIEQAEVLSGQRAQVVRQVVVRLEQMLAAREAGSGRTL